MTSVPILTCFEIPGSDPALICASMSVMQSLPGSCFRRRLQLQCPTNELVETRLMNALPEFTWSLRR